MGEQTRTTDGGFTLIETVLVIVVTGILMAAVSMSIVVAIKAAPSTEQRLDDARATRGLATWLSHDTTSTPPFLPEQAQGGINITTSPTADNNDCGGNGSNLLHLQWTEQATVDRTFVANYRFVVDGGEGRIVRYSCWRQSLSGPFGNFFQLNITSGLSTATPPVVTVDQPVGSDVLSVSFQLTGQSGEQVLVETGSRNPADFFP